MKPFKIDNETCDLMMGGGEGLSISKAHDLIQRGDRESRFPPPPGKSQVNLASIGIQQSDPAPWKKLDPPPLENVGPSGTLENYSFFETVK